jgi:hypothetical protein
MSAMQIFAIACPLLATLSGSDRLRAFRTFGVAIIFSRERGDGALILGLAFLFLLQSTAGEIWSPEIRSSEVPCSHTHQIRIVTPSALGCEECLRIGSRWVHLRLCRECGHVGCCDQSPHRHAREHFKASGHPIIEGYDPPEGWGRCYIDDIEVDLPSQTPHNGPIPRFV